MIELPILHGCCTIQLYRKVSGSNAWPHTIKWEVCGNTLVSEADFDRLNQHRWLRNWNKGTRSYYAYRRVKYFGKWINVWMARDVLGLPVDVGHVAGEGDHKTYDTLENTSDNLRSIGISESRINRRMNGSLRFFGIFSVGKYGFRGGIHVDYTMIMFTTVKSDVEAALTYNYGSYLVRKEFARLNVISDDEMPTAERQWELYDIVVSKLMEYGIQVET